MGICLGKQGNVTSTGVAPTHGTILELIQKAELHTKYLWTNISPRGSLSVIYITGTYV
jgi:hypothetical protein